MLPPPSPLPSRFATFVRPFFPVLVLFVLVALQQNFLNPIPSGRRERVIILRGEIHGIRVRVMYISLFRYFSVDNLLRKYVHVSLLRYNLLDTILLNEFVTSIFIHTYIL